MLLDRRIIHALYLDPRAPFSRLAEVLGSSEPTVSRRYRRLFDDRILRVVGQLDSQRFGQYDWAVRIRCAPGSAPTVATKLAQHPDTSWVQLTSGGTEIFSLIHSRDGEQRTPLLLSQLSVGRQVVDYEAYCLLHLFATGLSAPPGRATSALGRSPNSSLRHGTGRRSIARRPSCRTPTGRSSRPLRTTAALPIGSWQRARTGTSRPSDGESKNSLPQASSSLTWTSPATPLGSALRPCCGCRWPPRNLRDVGQALASRPEFPFVAATTGSTNLVAALVCPDDRSLYEYLTDEMTALDGLTHIETAPVMQFVKMHATMAPRQP